VAAVTQASALPGRQIIIINSKSTGSPAKLRARAPTARATFKVNHP
jgi:hypothetical protein